MDLAKGKFFIACHGLIKKGSYYLVTKRSSLNDFMPGYWDLPGGTIDFGESLETALIREISEETWLKVKPIKIISAFTKAFPAYGRQVTQLTFLCQYVSGQVVLNPEEHSEYKWVLKKDIAKLKLIPFVKDLIKKY